MVAAPSTVLAQLDAVRRVSPRLVCLVVAPLALLARKGYSDTDLSAGHVLLLKKSAVRQKKTPALGAR
jgi:hypothetical protein